MHRFISTQFKTATRIWVDRTLTSRNCKRPSSPRYETARWADSTGMMSWTNIIFSDRIRSIGGKSSMNLSIFLFLSCSSSREPGRKKLYVLIRSKWVFFSDLIRNESELRLVCVGLILFQFRYCHFATVNWIENFASLPFFNGSFSERRLNGRVFCLFTTCWGLK